MFTILLYFCTILGFFFVLFVVVLSETSFLFFEFKKKWRKCLFTPWHLRWDEDYWRTRATVSLFSFCVNLRVRGCVLYFFCNWYAFVCACTYACVCLCVSLWPCVWHVSAANATPFTPLSFPPFIPLFRQTFPLTQEKRKQTNKTNLVSSVPCLRQIILFRVGSVALGREWGGFLFFPTLWCIVRA